MLRQQLRLYCIIVLSGCLLVHGNWQLYKAVTPTDALRQEYLSAQQQLSAKLQRRPTSLAYQLRSVYNATMEFISDYRMHDVFIANKYNLIKIMQWKQLQAQLQTIEEHFLIFKNLLRTNKNVGVSNALLDASAKISDRRDQILNTLTNVEYVMVNNTMYNRSRLISAHHMCETQQSTQQFTLLLYADIALIELKAHIMMQFALRMLQVCSEYQNCKLRMPAEGQTRAQSSLEQDYSGSRRMLQREFVQRARRAQTLVIAVMQDADAVVWRCDPPEHVRGETYEEVTHLLQGYVENMCHFENVAPAIFRYAMTHKCEDFAETKATDCQAGEFCENQPKCQGTLYDCRTMSSRVDVCQAERSDAQRRYDYIVDGQQRRLGPEKQCTRRVNRVKAFKVVLNILVSCNYCFCLCDEVNMKSERYFSLRAVLSDVQQNKIITGLRLVKRRRVFHWQIQQGQLLPYGAINASSVAWRTVDEFNIYDDGVMQGNDFSMLNYNKRFIKLDDVRRREKDLVLTGVRFDLDGRHLRLAAQFTGFNFKNGVLSSIISSWDFSDINEAGRRKLDVTNAVVPTHFPVPSITNSRHNDFIEFTPSSEIADVAQRTVPFIDVQEVAPLPPVPLQGVGIYHKKRSDNGGFLAPRVFTYDYAS